MKIRKGFISNSSSSSFICDICGTMDSGYDCAPHELGFAKLPCGHLICMEEVINLPDEEFAVLVADELKQYEPKQYSVDYFKSLDGIETDISIKEKYYKLTRKHYIKEQCPICTNKVILDKDLLSYVLIQIGKDKQTVTDEIKQKFATRDDMLDFFKKK